MSQFEPGGISGAGGRSPLKRARRSSPHRSSKEEQWSGDQRDRNCQGKRPSRAVTSGDDPDDDKDESQQKQAEAESKGDPGDAPSINA